MSPLAGASWALNESASAVLLWLTAPLPDTIFRRFNTQPGLTVKSWELSPIQGEFVDLLSNQLSVNFGV